MPVELAIRGGADLTRIAARLKETGDKILRRELLRGINRATRPMKDAARRSAIDTLPSRGGLNEWVGAAKLSTSTRPGRDPAVRVTAKLPGHDLEALDRGRLRHPLFGNRRHWFNQAIPPGWFSEAMEREAPRALREIVDVLAGVERQIT